MKVQISFILICVFSSNCVCKDSSIDEDKYIDSNESSESEDKNTKLELNKARKHSHENNIHISSSSDTSEDYNKKAAAIDSTIEVSDHAYQANKDAKESEGDDHETLQDYPYTASVLRKGAHYASGALVGERWILSSAAEFYNVRESIRLFRARVGSVDCKKGGILTPLLSIAIHPKFILGHHAFDISLLKTAEPLLLSSVVKPIGISRIVQVATAKLLTTYWPRIVMKHGVAPSTAKERVKYNSMRVSTQRLEPTEECAALLAAVNVTLDKNSQCLMPLRVHHSDCMPDVGAPVVAVDGLWGITSGWVSPECPTILLPTIFTRVSRLAIRAWINDHIQTQATT